MKKNAKLLDIHEHSSMKVEKGKKIELLCFFNSTFRGFFFNSQHFYSVRLSNVESWNNCKGMTIKSLIPFCILQFQWTEF